MNIARYDKRILSYIIDLIFSLLFPSAALVCSFLFIEKFYEIPWYFIAIAFVFASWISYSFIFTLFLFASNGRTLGSLIFGIKVIRPEDLKHLTFKECLARSINLGLIVFVIFNAIFVLVTHTEKSIFDRLSGTLVIDHRNRY